MIGPSSSHTAGAVKIGLIARKLLGEKPVKAEILLHGSFAMTGSGEKLYHLVRTAMKIIEREFQIRISDTEVAYIMDNFDTE